MPKQLMRLRLKFLHVAFHNEEVSSDTRNKTDSIPHSKNWNDFSLLLRTPPHYLQLFKRLPVDPHEPLSAEAAGLDGTEWFSSRAHCRANHTSQRFDVAETKGQTFSFANNNCWMTVTKPWRQRFG